MQLHPADTGGTFLEIDWDRENDPRGNWAPAGGTGWKPFVRSEVVSDIVAAEVQSPDPSALAKRWSAVTEIPLGKDPEGRIVMHLSNAAVRFVNDPDGRGEGLGGMDVRAADPERVLAAAERRGLRTWDRTALICGMRFHLV